MIKENRILRQSYYQWFSKSPYMSKIEYFPYLIMPVNFSLTDLGPTHTISAEAILAITFVICYKK